MEPNDLDLEEATRKIAYEMYHFRCLVRIHRDGNNKGGLWRQLVSQSLLLHFRILFEFFYFDPCGDYVRVTDFVDRGFTTAPNHSAPSTLGMSRGQITKALNERLVHFSKGRWEGYHPGLENYQPWFDEVERHILTFKTALPDHLMKVFNSRLTEFKERDTVFSVPIKGVPELTW